MLRALALIGSIIVLAGCSGLPTALQPTTQPACDPGSVAPLGSARVAYAASAPKGTIAYRRPGGTEIARFGPTNVNDYPTVFEALARRVDGHCKATWYRVQLPIKPNGITGWVPARDVTVSKVRTRIVV